MVLFIRDNECFEPRVRNYIEYFDNNEIDYHVVGWNRNGTAKDNSRITFFQRKAEYGKRLANIPNKIMWMFFVMRQVIKHRKNCSVIHACDIDAVLPALFIGKILRKKVIFDIFDWISSLTEKGVVYKIVELLQNYANKHSDYVILCEEERKAQAKATNENVLVLPNIPASAVVFDEPTRKRIEKQREGFDIIVSYVGVFDKDRGIENLLKCVSELPHVLLNIGGFGVLNELIEQYASKYPNICLWGRVEYSVGQTIMKNSDMIAAMYHLTSPLHKYAAPNKYYESLYLEVPMITTENTLVGAKVEKYDTGFVISEDYNDLFELINNRNLKEECCVKSLNCNKVWETVYKTYFLEYMNSQYMPFIQSGNCNSINNKEKRVIK